ncbi:MAG: hypothetical protein IKF71_03500 [Bacilli bacterium]|nr:hypothetical protein [Bacilli bacterium]
MKEENKLEDIENDFPYRDLLLFEYLSPRKHPRQERESRAGQFSPFAALSGYDGQIKEVSRYTTQKVLLSESEKEELDQQIQWIQYHNHRYVKITYFQKDLKKTGGKYIDKVGALHRIDSIHRLLLFCDKTVIKMQDIVKIEIIQSSD